ncbi:hypothetical protein Taro_013664 [Colocasia esculenta]|uniref:Uncharacterized protein n=1 Tax=Colocasia esculenta TaxID=4460 RepID=A0A843U741_COLES|nr:hypothetical protein [Colocasia esculenta]
MLYIINMIYITYICGFRYYVDSGSTFLYIRPAGHIRGKVFLRLASSPFPFSPLMIGFFLNRVLGFKSPSFCFCPVVPLDSLQNPTKKVEKS